MTFGPSNTLILLSFITFLRGVGVLDLHASSKKGFRHLPSSPPAVRGVGAPDLHASSSEGDQGPQPHASTNEGGWGAQSPCLRQQRGLGFRTCTSAGSEGVGIGECAHSRSMGCHRTSREGEALGIVVDAVKLLSDIKKASTSSRLVRKTSTVQYI
ncbi:hypothetical protein B296_00019113 [Ensete ventricosum]|uniref:Uncharacterized protein n=1 Tax=Ensete ventricosum TaxID=4639 RepID=A0A426ZJD2_ENSVE|nr:hypothetical protein B296_00019113 [Ensete ventricosum]